MSILLLRYIKKKKSTYVALHTCGVCTWLSDTSNPVTCPMRTVHRPSRQNGSLRYQRVLNRYGNTVCDVTPVRLPYGPRMANVRIHIRNGLISHHSSGTDSFFFFLVEGSVDNLCAVQDKTQERNVRRISLNTNSNANITRTHCSDVSDALMLSNTLNDRHLVRFKKHVSHRTPRNQSRGKQYETNNLRKASRTHPFDGRRTTRITRFNTLIFSPVSS